MSEEKQVTDEEIIDVLHKIKQYCDEHKDCLNCLLHRDNCNECIFTDNIVSPCEWDLTIRKVIF